MEVEINGHAFAATLETSENGVLTCVLTHYKPTTETVETTVIRDVTREVEVGENEDGTKIIEKITTAEEVVLRDTIDTHKMVVFDHFKIYADPGQRVLKQMCLEFLRTHRKIEKTTNGSN
jgi:hypothetical protein